MSAVGNPRTRATRALDRLLGKPIRGIVGWRKSATEVVIAVPGRAGYIYVTRIDQTVLIARNEANVPRAAFYPVWMVLRGNSWVITGRDSSNDGALVNLPDSEYGLPPHPLGSHLDTNIIAPSDGQVLLFESGEWVNGDPPPSGVSNLDELDDTLIVDPVYGDILWYDNVEGAWINIPAPWANGLGDLPDVNIDYDTISDGQILVWDDAEGEWINSGPRFVPVTGGVRVQDSSGNAWFFLANGGNISVGHTNTPQKRFHIGVGAGSAILIQGGSTVGDTAEILFKMSGTDFGSTFIKGAIYFVRAASNARGDIYFAINNADSSTNVSVFDTVMALMRTGFVGFGTVTPQGKVHAHDGTAGHLFVSKTGIVGSSVTIVPDGTGDVVRGVVIDGVAYNNTPGLVKVDVLVAPSGNADVTVGSDTLRFAVSSGGAVTVIRQAGSATWEIGVTLTWL